MTDLSTRRPTSAASPPRFGAAGRAAKLLPPSDPPGTLDRHELEDRLADALHGEPRRPVLTTYVLAGGLGTRLASLYPDLPKSLVPVSGRPFVDHQLAWLAAHGLTDVVLCAGVGARALLDHVGDGGAFGVRVRTVVEERPRGTAGALVGSAHYEVAR